MSGATMPLTPGEVATRPPVPGDPDFNPHIQPITVFYPDGTNFTLPLSEVDTINYQSIKLCVVFASQIGACSILLLLLFFLTHPKKRLAPIFIFNSFSLFFVVVRSVLQILYFTGPWFGAFAFYAYYFDDIPGSAYATSIAATVIQLLLHICIEVSLVLQVRVVYMSNPGVCKIMTVAATFIALFSVGWWMAVVIQNCRAILKAEAWGGNFVYPTARAILAFSICFFAMVFVVKLGMAIRQRKVLGLEKWGPLQVIFVMGCQTLVVPAIFSVLENIESINFDGMSSLTATLVAISLPVSSMWAAASAESPSPAFKGYEQPDHNSNSQGSYLIKSRNNSTSTSATMLSRGAMGKPGVGWREDVERRGRIGVEKLVEVGEEDDGKA
ncbi:fungal pheromone mating factor STE2 GPCR-domain-containing protein [Kalaharituber pfeilii]|nr:fungal pheromone mating factor STE2 GPCR-domain-containing protein [Kalaharituber pfeilii]